MSNTLSILCYAAAWAAALFLVIRGASLVETSLLLIVCLLWGIGRQLENINRQLEKGERP